jgi:arylformamidase
VAYAVLAGVDSWNVDDTNDPSRRVHTRLLAEEILIVEHLCNLAALPASSFRFSAVPLRSHGRLVPGARLRRAVRLTDRRKGMRRD